MKLKIPGDYAARRRAEYPPLEELADALVHERAGDRSKLEAYLAKCADVKARFPKPPRPAGS